MQLLLPRHAAAATVPMRASCSSSSFGRAATIPRPRLVVERRQRQQQQQQPGPPRGRAPSVVFASSPSSPSSPQQPTKASLLVAQGRAKYAAGDRMGALALFETALKQSPSAPEAAAASWNATVVHCSFGDVELAQITLRDALAAGLDFDAALSAEGRRVVGARVDEIAAAVAENDESRISREANDPAAAAAAALRLPFAGSPQVASQLRKFARAFARASSSSSGSSGRGTAAALPPYSSSSSTSSASSSPSSSPISVDGIDASPAAIAKRVAVLLAVLLGLGVALYLYGLQYLYPTS